MLIHLCSFYHTPKFYTIPFSRIIPDVLKTIKKNSVYGIRRARAVPFMAKFFSASCASLAERFLLIGNCNAISYKVRKRLPILETSPTCQTMKFLVLKTMNWSWNSSTSVYKCITGVLIYRHNWCITK